MSPYRPHAPQRLLAAAAAACLLSLPVAHADPAPALAGPAPTAGDTAPSVSGSAPARVASAAQVGAPARAGLARRGALTTQWSRATAPRGQRGVVVRGRSARRGVRPVLLQVRVPRGWRTVQARRTTRFGSYRLVLPTGRLGVFSYRVVVPVTARERRAGVVRAVSAPWRFRVVPARRATTPAGDPSDHTAMLDRPARWNPCRVINYRVNAAHGPATALRDTQAAVARIERASGLDLEYVGSTSLIPQHQRETFPQGTHIVIAWASRSQSAMISGDGVAGVGGPVGWGNTVDRNGDPVLTWREGTVVLNSAFNGSLAPGFGAGATLGKLLMHEIGHVVGLGHARGREQVMYPTLQHDTATAWGAGDLTGLRLHGASQGCLYEADGALARTGRTSVYSELTEDTLADLRR